MTTIGQRREHYCFALQAIVLRAPTNIGQSAKLYRSAKPHHEER